MPSQESVKSSQKSTKSTRSNPEKTIDSEPSDSDKKVETTEQSQGETSQKLSGKVEVIDKTIFEKESVKKANIEKLNNEKEDEYDDMNKEKRTDEKEESEKGGKKSEDNGDVSLEEEKNEVKDEEDEFLDAVESQEGALAETDHDVLVDNQEEDDDVIKSTSKKNRPPPMPQRSYDDAEFDELFHSAMRNVDQIEEQIFSPLLKEPLRVLGFDPPSFGDLFHSAMKNVCQIETLVKEPITMIRSPGGTIQLNPYHASALKPPKPLKRVRVNSLEKERAYQVKIRENEEKRLAKEQKELNKNRKILDKEQKILAKERKMLAKEKKRKEARKTAAEKEKKKKKKILREKMMNGGKSKTDWTAPTGSEIPWAKVKEKMLNRQVKVSGTWVQCDKCSKWRYLSDVHDPSTLPDEWMCKMNSDSSMNRCSQEEDIEDEEAHNASIYLRFAEGSVVMAKMDGFPWWPAVVETDPDEETFYMFSSESSLSPSHYHCVFLDKNVSRSWVRDRHLQPYQGFKENKNANKGYRKQLSSARENAEKALNMTIPDRLKAFGFAATFNGGRASTSKTAVWSQDSSQVSKATVSSKGGSAGSAKLKPGSDSSVNLDTMMADVKIDLDEADALLDHLEEDLLNDLKVAADEEKKAEEVTKPAKKKKEKVKKEKTKKAEKKMEKSGVAKPDFGKKTKKVKENVAETEERIEAQAQKEPSEPEKPENEGKNTENAKNTVENTQKIDEDIAALAGNVADKNDDDFEDPQATPKVTNKVLEWLAKHDKPETTGNVAEMTEEPGTDVEKTETPKTVEEAEAKKPTKGRKRKAEDGHGSDEKKEKKQRKKNEETGEKKEKKTKKKNEVAEKMEIDPYEFVGTQKHDVNLEKTETVKPKKSRKKKEKTEKTENILTPSFDQAKKPKKSFSVAKKADDQNQNDNSVEVTERVVKITDNILDTGEDDTKENADPFEFQETQKPQIQPVVSPKKTEPVSKKSKKPKFSVKAKKPELDIKVTKETAKEEKKNKVSKKENSSEEFDTKPTKEFVDVEKTQLDIRSQDMNYEKFCHSLGSQQCTPDSQNSVGSRNSLKIDLKKSLKSVEGESDSPNFMDKMDGNLHQAEAAQQVPVGYSDGNESDPFEMD